MTDIAVRLVEPPNSPWVALPEFGTISFGGLDVSRAWVAGQSVDDLVALGWARATVAPAAELGAGFSLGDTEVVDDDGTPRRVWKESLGLAGLKAKRVEQIRALRWTKEVGGILVNGAPIATDERTQTRVAAALELFTRDEVLLAVDWEVAPGQFVTMDEATVAAIGVAIGRHIQACFSRSRELIEAVEAAVDAEAVLAIDISAGWPS